MQSAGESAAARLGEKRSSYLSHTRLSLVTPPPPLSPAPWAAAPLTDLTNRPAISAAAPRRTCRGLDWPGLARGLFRPRRPLVGGGGRGCGAGPPAGRGGRWPGGGLVAGLWPDPEP